MILFHAVISAALLLEPSPDIVERLIRRDYPPSAISLPPSERAAAVKRLQAEQPKASGQRAQEIAFLLASYGADYTRNRDTLVKGLHDAEYDRVQDTATLLIGLYENGHRDVLPALLSAGKDSDAALSELLGTFYSGVLRNSPVGFIRAIRPMPAATQEKTRWLAGAMDGGGMDPETLRMVKAGLNRIGSPVARRCLRQIEKANTPDPT